MKRTLLCVVAIVTVTYANAQCNCGGMTSSLSFTETGGNVLNLAKGEWLTEAYTDYRSFNPIHTSESGHDHANHTHSNETNAELKSSIISLIGLRLGLTNKTTISLQQPFISIKSSVSNTSGLGDLMVIANRVIVEKANYSVALIGGVELPTGKKSYLEAESNSVIGSGSFDFIIGGMALKSMGKLFIRGNVLYKKSLEGFDATNYGDFFSSQIIAGYHINDNNCTNKENKKPFLITLFGGGLLEWNGSQIKQNIINENTGGNVLFGQLGLLINKNKWSIPITLTAPIIQTLNGEQSLTAFRARLGIIKTF